MKMMASGYISHKFFPIPEIFKYSQVLIIYEKEFSDYYKMEQNIEKILGDKVSFYLTRENQPSNLTFTNEINQHKSMADIFPVIFLAVAFLTILTTMKRIINKQRLQIGILKALGFKNRKILIHYVSYGFAISLIASMLGAVLGPLILPQLFYPSMSSFYTLPEWKPSINSSFVILGMIITLMVGLEIIISCYKILKEKPVESLKPKKIKIPKKSFIENFVFWNKCNFNTRYNIRDISRNKTRSTMAIIGSFGVTALLVCAFGMNENMNILGRWVYEDINTFNTKIEISEMLSDKQILEIKEKCNGEEVVEGQIEIKIDEEKVATGLKVLDEESKLIKLTDKDTKVIELSKDDVAITYKISQKYGINIGDTIRWHIYGSPNWVEAEITKINRDPMSQGITIYKNTYEDLGYEFKPTSIITMKKDIENIYGIKTIKSISDLRDSFDELTEAMNLMVYILVIAAVLLAVVVTYNLGILYFAETEREFATLKVLGMKTKKIFKLLVTQNIFLSFVGFIGGIPTGKWIMDVIASMNGDAFDMTTIVSVKNMVMSGAIVIGLLVIVNLIFLPKIKKINMVESLKGLE